MGKALEFGNLTKLVGLICRFRLLRSFNWGFLESSQLSVV